MTESNVITLRRDLVLDDLLTEQEEVGRTQLVLADYEHVLLTLWIGSVHAMDAFDVMPILRAQSEVPGCGKTVLLEHVARSIGSRAILTSNLSEAALFRLAATGRAVLELDEADVLLPAGRSSDRAEAIRGLVAAGWRRGSKVYRVEAASSKSGDFKLAEFEVFAAFAIAGLGQVPPTIADRSIPLLMKRATPEEFRRLRPLRYRDAEAAAAPLRTRWHEWAEGAIEVLADARPPIPAMLAPRQQDNVEPLLAVADLAGGSWPGRARAAVIRLYGTPDVSGREVYGQVLLRGLREVFEINGNPAFLATSTVIRDLAGLDTGPFAARYRVRPSDPSADLAGAASRLAQDLRGFGVRPQQRHQGDGVLRGYFLADLTDAFDRYLAEVATVAAVAAPGDAYAEAPEQLDLNQEEA